MGRRPGNGRVTTSVTMSPEFFQLAKNHHIGFSEAMRVGMSLLFAEKGLKDYDNRLSLFRKMQLFQQKTEQLTEELDSLKEKSLKLKPKQEE
jgi:endo-1,4-beta-D-glucanase Y